MLDCAAVNWGPYVGGPRALADWELEAEAEYWSRALAEAENDDGREFAELSRLVPSNELQRRAKLGYQRAHAPYDLAPVVERLKREAITAQVFMDRIGDCAKPGLRKVIFACPFHSEKTPSLVVWRDSNRWCCFGCGNRGDVIAAAMKLDGSSFVQAVLRLADEWKIDVPRKPPERPVLKVLA